MPHSAKTRLIHSLGIQARVVHALIMREIITRYGRHNIGFAWLFAEPMLFTLGIIILWSVYREGGSTAHINIISYALTGYSTVLNWRNGIGRCTLAIEPNASLLFHRNVRVIDLFIARLILEIGGVTLSSVILLVIMIAVGLIPPPVNSLNMILGWVLLSWYTSAMGILIGSLTLYSDLVDRIWHPIAYFQLPISGAFIMASYLPPNLRTVVMLFPVPHCVELLRYGYYGDKITPIYNVAYVCACCLILTWLALLAVRGASKRVEAR
ncbi:ABC transporter permease [Burkholderia sp. PAMC 26561]|uniref:ABC transporter permease n=1 Tax=Burkholderia sp. PAMC 26561 TaxID=1795043 RepID=UPI00076B2EF5|nr:sugar ABC transporter permease [Burkholderia sp. PAMC 26561]